MSAKGSCCCCAGLSASRSLVVCGKSLNSPRKEDKSLLQSLFKRSIGVVLMGTAVTEETSPLHSTLVRNCHERNDCREVTGQLTKRPSEFPNKVVIRIYALCAHEKTTPTIQIQRLKADRFETHLGAGGWVLDDLLHLSQCWNPLVTNCWSWIIRCHRLKK